MCMFVFSNVSAGIALVSRSGCQFILLLMANNLGKDICKMGVKRDCRRRKKGRIAFTQNRKKKTGEMYCNKKKSHNPGGAVTPKYI